MFNNNNYLPDLNHYRPAAGQQMPANVPGSPAPLDPPLPPPAAPPVSGSGFGHVGNFRFLSPTQVTAVPTWMPAACVVSTISAPGMGTSWQHSVPITMPWANHIAPHFTAQSSPSQSLPVYTMPMGILPQTTMMRGTPKPSVRCLRLKRRFRASINDDPEGPSSKRYLSERMASWFKQLQITPTKGQGDDARSASGQEGTSSRLDNGWQRFHEVEKRLREDLEDVDLEMSGTGAGKRNGFGAAASGLAGAARGAATTGGGSGGGFGMENGGVVLQIPDEVKKEVQKREPVLPAQIMKTITSPCMDLVLWKPPEAIITSYLQVSPDSSNLSGESSSHSSSSSSSSSGSGSTQTARNGNGNGNGSDMQFPAPSSASSSAGSSFSTGSFFGSGLAQSGGSVTQMDSMEMFDCVDDDDMDL
ncbi:uncharacterized protein LOC143288170 [Babylonia areolata]|uniref:uncharacterized protein LOC143288170 n=1 Tax=Babylonia areolata TaxID=304850 RepID=UPI003FD5F7CC